ncbi:MAG: hypothetical protein JXA18_04835 [Chitinispirillaceae bacterium]|nr:hypothetical protein [Chitinispirillaceae bacterium]
MKGNVAATVKGTLGRLIAGVLMLLHCFLIGTAVAGDTDDDSTLNKLSISGKLQFDCAEMLKARTSAGGTSNPGTPTNVDHIWYGHTIAELSAESRMFDWFLVRAGFELRQYLTMLPLIEKARRDPFFGNTSWMGFYLREGQGIFTLLKNHPVSIEAAFGYMPYKYNPEVRNLGEFLFRSGTYPLYLLTEFDRPFARLTGLRTGLQMKNDMIDAKIDAFGLIERELRPFNDISIAVIAGIDFLKIISAGCGIDFARLLPMDSRLTIPEESENEYVVDSMPVIDSSTGAIVGSRPVYEHYTFQGTKLMLRATVDPFGMLRGTGSFVDRLLGENGGKIYGEYALIGLENYPVNQQQLQDYNRRGYKLADDRSPWMAGCTVPFWKILDIFALEVERFPGYSPDSYFRQVINGWPLSTSSNGNPGVYDTTTYVPRWNWSIYMKKQITRHFSAVCQVGRDHQRWEFNPAQADYYDFEAAMVKPDEWGWRVAGIFNF